MIDILLVLYSCIIQSEYGRKTRGITDKKLRSCLEIRCIRQGAERWYMEGGRARVIAGLTAAAVNGDRTDRSGGTSHGSRIWYNDWWMNRFPIHINRY